jgi:hypothetical protein
MLLQSQLKYVVMNSVRSCGCILPSPIVVCIVRGAPRSRKVAETGPYLSSLAEFTHTAFSEVCPVPDAVITVICAPDDRWSNNPKHVELFTEIK